MFLTSSKLLIFVVILLIVIYSESECKRGGGGRRGSVSRGSSVWGRSKHQSHDLRNNQRKSKSQPAEGDMVKKPPDVPPADSSKPSAPPSPSKIESKKVTTGSENTPGTSGNTQERPIGWDVGQGAKTDGGGNKNIGWNVGNTNNPQSSSGAVGGSPPKNAPPPYSAPGNPQPSYSGPGNSPPSHTGYGNPPPPYSTHGNAPPPYSGPGNLPLSHTGYGNPPPPYSAHGNAPTPYSGPGNPPPPYSGPNSYPGAGHNYQHGQVPYQPGPYGTPNSGFMPSGGYGYGGGGLFGGNNYNKHGFGGYGGYGGYGVGGYGKKFGGGFGMGFGKHAVRNVVMGLLVWHLVSGLTRRPYNVYNYYNNPEKVPDEIPLPANAIVLCPDNVTSLCAPNTAPLCTSNSTIMCVVLAQKTVPCDDNSTLKCASSTATCGDDDETPCPGKDTTPTSVNIPCITNATITGKVKNSAISGLNTSDTTDLCVTTLAVPQPEDQQAVNQPACQMENGKGSDNTNSTLCTTVNATSQSSVEKTETKQTASK